MAIVTDGHHENQHSRNRSAGAIDRPTPKRSGMPIAFPITSLYAVNICEDIGLPNRKPCA
jgi:hypothetical protein